MATARTDSSNGRTRAGTPAGRPDPVMFLAMHAAMRADVRRLVAASASPALGRYATGIRGWYRKFRGVIENHHRVEDEIFFPAIAEKAKAFALVRDRLAREHEALDGALTMVGESLDALVSAGVTPETRAGFADATRTLQAILLPHLDSEDMDLVPLIENNLDAATYAALSEKAFKSSPRSEITFIAPWVTRNVPPDWQSRVQGEVPRVIVVLERFVWRRRHDRLEAPLVLAAR